MADEAANLPLAFSAILAGGLLLTHGVTTTKAAFAAAPSAASSSSSSSTITGPATPSGPLPGGASKFSPNQRAFASEFAAKTHLDPGVVLAWIASEQYPGHSANNVGNQNWLSVGLNGSQQRAPSSVWNDPITAANATAAYLAGTPVGPWTSNPSFRQILAAAGKGAAAEIAAIDSSGWVGPSTGYGGNLQRNYASYGH